MNADATPATSRRATKTAPGQGEAYWFYGDLAILRSPDGAFPVIIEHHLGPGARAPLHVHVDVDDSFFVVTGEVAVRAGDDAFVASAGDYVSLPKGVPHTLAALGDGETVLLQTHDDVSFQNFIRAVGVPGERPKPDLAAMDFEAMNRIAGETGQPVLGPPMSDEEIDAIVRASG